MIRFPVTFGSIAVQLMTKANAETIMISFFIVISPSFCPSCSLYSKIYAK